MTILKQFFASRITTANCADFKKIFEAKDQASPGQKDTRLQTIWNQLPSNTNPDFAGMDAKINAVKANAFTGEFPGSKSLSSPEKYLAYVNQMALAMKLTNDGDVAPLFKKTNVRVYEALLGMDAVVAANCGATSTITADWASSYKTWITNFLSSQSNAVTGQIGSILSDNSKLGPDKQVGTSVNGQQTVTTTNSIGRGVSALLAAYPTPNAFTLNAGALLDFPNTKSLNIKRQACSKPPVGCSTVAPPYTYNAMVCTPVCGDHPVCRTIDGQTPTGLPSAPATTTSAAPVTTTTAAEQCFYDNCECEDRPGGRCRCQCLCNGKVSPDSKC